MKLLILAPKGKSISTDMLIEEGKKIFKEVDFLPLKKVIINASGEFGATCEDKNLSEYNYLLPRIDSIRASFGYHVMKYFDTTSINKPYTSESVLIAHNKFATIFELKKAGIPVPDTYYTASRESAEDLIRRMKFPAMIKLVSSFGGKGVMYIESKQAALSVVKTLDLLKQHLMLEKFVENPGEDIRGFVIGDEIIGMKRIAAKGEKRANIASGAKAVSYNLTDEEKEVAFKSAEVLKAKVCAIDLIIDKNLGPQVIEANINPGLKGITKATSVNVAQKIIQYCHDQCKK
jgi:ribosomal protein S6--L-glutamate ligase